MQNIKQYDKGILLQQVLQQGGVPIDLSIYTIKCTIYSGNKLFHAEREAIVLDAAQGIVGYRLASGETNELGIYRYEFKLFFEETYIETFPSKDYYTFSVQADLTGTDSPIEEPPNSPFSLLLAGAVGRYVVVNYGALGDDVADDTEAIKACLDAATSYSTIYFPPGVYRTRPIAIMDKPGLKIVGHSATLRLIGEEEVDFFTLDRCPYSEISGLSLVGTKIAGEDLTHGLVLRATYFSWVHHCRITECNGDAVHLLGYYDNEEIPPLFRGCDEVHVDSCFLQSNKRYGIYVDSVADVNIHHNNVEFNGDDGIYITNTTDIGSGNLDITHNQILGNDGHGLELVNNTCRTFIKDNHIRNNGKMGIRYIGGRQYWITGNNIHLNGRLFNYSAGITVGYNRAGFIKDNMITCTDFSPTQGYAVEVYSCQKMQLIGNLLEDNLQAGFSISSDSTDVIVRDNIGAADSVQ